jgi:hypothetical protein
MRQGEYYLGHGRGDDAAPEQEFKMPTNSTNQTADLPVNIAELVSAVEALTGMTLLNGHAVAHDNGVMFCCVGSADTGMYSVTLRPASGGMRHTRPTPARYEVQRAQLIDGGRGWKVMMGCAPIEGTDLAAAIAAAMGAELTEYVG